MKFRSVAELHTTKQQEAELHQPELPLQNFSAVCSLQTIATHKQKCQQLSHASRMQRKFQPVIILQVPTHNVCPLNVKPATASVAIGSYSNTRAQQCSPVNETHRFCKCSWARPCKHSHETLNLKTAQQQQHCCCQQHKREQPDRAEVGRPEH